MGPAFRRLVPLVGALALFVVVFAACAVAGFAVLGALYPAFGVTARVPVGGPYPAAPLGFPLFVFGASALVALVLAGVGAALLRAALAARTRPVVDAVTDPLWPA